MSGARVGHGPCEIGSRPALESQVLDPDLVKLVHPVLALEYQVLNPDLVK